MEIEDFDYLSPKIAIFYHGRNRHSSIFGGILSIILIFLIITYIFYCVINICYHKPSNFITYKTHKKDVGYFAFSKNENNIFHFFQLLNNENNQFTKFNTKYVRIFMTHINNGYKNNFENLKDSEHWVYDKCRKGIDDRNIQEIIFTNKTDFENGACLRYYYDHLNKKYYSIDDIDNFIYPSLNEKISSDEFLYLNTIVEKCHNDSILYNILGPCETEYEINKYFNNIRDVYMQLLERKIEVENYNNPILYYFNSISGSLGDNSKIAINNVNISPFEIEIRNGIIYPISKKIKTYILDQNNKETWKKINNNNNNKYILTIFNYWLINTAYIFKGEYQTLYDILSNIGGIMQLFYYIFFAINFISNKFKIMQDSKNLFFQIKNCKVSYKAEKEKSRFSSMSQIFKDIIYNKPGNISSSVDISKTNNMMHLKKNINNKLSTENDPNIKSFVENKNLNNYYNRISSNSLSIFNPYTKKFSNLEKNDPKLNNEINNISLVPLINNNKNDILKNNIDIKNRSMDQKIRNEIKMEFNEDVIIKSPGKKNYIRFSQNLSKFINEKRQKIKVPDLSKRYLKKYTSFSDYIISIICPKANRGKVFYIINKFRKKLISEEHLFNNQIFIYYLEKYFDINESEKIDFMELYNYL